MSSYEKYELLLQKHNVTSYKVCKDTGIGKTTIANWKSRPGSDLSFRNMMALAKYFKVPAEYFLG